MIQTRNCQARDTDAVGAKSIIPQQAMSVGQYDMDVEGEVQSGDIQGVNKI
jgi:hypothetical protein